MTYVKGLKTSQREVMRARNITHEGTPQIVLSILRHSSIHSRRGEQSRLDSAVVLLQPLLLPSTNFCAAAGEAKSSCPEFSMALISIVRALKPLKISWETNWGITRATLHTLYFLSAAAYDATKALA